MDEPTLEPLETRVGLHPFLVGLRPHHIKLLADCAMAKSFAAGEYLFRQGEFANRFYLIEQGMVVLEALDRKGTCVTIEEVGAGKLVGWSWLFPPYIWHFDARAAEPTSALFFYGTILREYCARDPSLGFELMKRMSQVMVERLQSARTRLLTQHSGQIKTKKDSGTRRR
jgi:CRP/FNR family transcriptional regulator, cyclic AMP receptor protein